LGPFYAIVEAVDDCNTVVRVPLQPELANPPNRDLAVTLTTPTACPTSIYDVSLSRSNALTKELGYTRREAMAES
jgi:hypothetical protein